MDSHPESLWECLLSHSEFCCQFVFLQCKASCRLSGNFYFTRYMKCYIKSGPFSVDASWKGADYILALAPYLLQTPQGACRQWQMHWRCPLVALSSVECFLVLREHEGLAILAPMWLAKYFRQLKRGNIVFKRCLCSWTSVYKGLQCRRKQKCKISWGNFVFLHFHYKILRKFYY